MGDQERDEREDRDEGPLQTVMENQAVRWALGVHGEIGSAGLLDRAAALTYYAALSIAPAIVVLISVLGFVGNGAIDALLEQLEEFAPGASRDVVQGVIEDVGGIGTSSGVALFVVGLGTAFWSASGYVGAFGRAAEVIRRPDRHTAWWRALIRRVLVTTALFLLLLAITLMIVLSGPLAESFATLVGFDGGVAGLWSVIKWPIIVLSMALMVSVLFAAASGEPLRRFRPFSRGSLVTIAIWLPLSLGFSYYVSNASAYNRVYGSLAGFVIFLVWLWLTNVAMLLGVLAQARVDRRRDEEAAAAVSSGSPG